MIIAAYPGTGKSAFARQVEGAAALPMTPYKRILSPEWKTAPEPELAQPYHLRNPLFPKNYLVDILKAERDCRFVLIPTNFAVISCLRKDYGRKILICHPEDGCQEEYRMRFLSRSNPSSFRELLGSVFGECFDPVWEYKQYEKGGTYLPMGSGACLTDLIRRIEEERQADTTQPVEDGTIWAIEEELAEEKKGLGLYLSGNDERRFYPIKDLDVPEEQEFLAQVGRIIAEENIDLVPSIAPEGRDETKFAESFSTEDREAVMAFVSNHPRRQPEKLRKRPGKKDDLVRKRWKDAARREQIIYHRDYKPENYPDNGVLYFSRLPVAVARQLVAEGLLDPQFRYNESPSVEEMLAFCSGEDEDIWFFHGYTVTADRWDSRVTLDGFESFVPPAPERKEEFLRFNCRGEIEIAENGACWCWYD